MKISFKEPTIQHFNDRATIVTLNGKMRIPDFWWNVPYEITRWAYDHQEVEVHENICEAIMSIKVSGKAVRAIEDTEDEVYGRRIAESRAKIKLYRFMFTLIKKISTFYYELLFGKNISTDYVPEYSKESLCDQADKYKKLLDNELIHLDELLH